MFDPAGSLAVLGPLGFARAVSRARVGDRVWCGPWGTDQDGGTERKMISLCVAGAQSRQEP